VKFFLENARSGPGPRRVIAIAQPRGVQKKSWKVYLGCFAPPAQPKLQSAGVATELRAAGGSACASFRLRFRCFTAWPSAAKSTSGVATGQTINLSLPTLEGDPAAQLTQVATPLYAEEGADAAIRPWSRSTRLQGWCARRRCHPPLPRRLLLVLRQAGTVRALRPPVPAPGGTGANARIRRMPRATDPRRRTPKRWPITCPSPW